MQPSDRPNATKVTATVMIGTLIHRKRLTTACSVWRPYQILTKIARLNAMLAVAAQDNRAIIGAPPISPLPHRSVGAAFARLVFIHFAFEYPPKMLDVQPSHHLLNRPVLPLDSSEPNGTEPYSSLFSGRRMIREAVEGQQQSKRINTNWGREQCE
jgi:hypothetical protein